MDSTCSLQNLSSPQGSTAQRGGGSRLIYLNRRLLVVPIALLSLFLVTKGAAAASDSDGGQSSLSSTYGTQDSQQQLAASTTERPKITIDVIEPDSGPVTGDTRVLVRGGPFAQYQYIYPKPKCKFGHDEMIVDATYVMCTQAPLRIKQKEARHRERNDTCIQCDNAPASNKAENVLFTVSLTGDFQDITNSAQYTYYPPTRIYGIYPRYGPRDGDTIVQVWGENFRNHGENTFCSFGTVAAETEYKNSNFMICKSPPSAVVEKPIPLTVTLNNQQNSKDSLEFWYYSEPTVAVIEPDRGPETGGTKILLKGSNFDPFRSESIKNYNDTFCYFEALKQKVPATVVSSTNAYCVAPPSFVYKETVVEITLNNQQYSDDENKFSFYKPPLLFDISPREGPVSGGTRVILVGANFADTNKIRCKFNETVVIGKFLQSSEIECVSPPSDHAGFVQLSVATELDMFSAAVQFLYYEKPVIDSIDPICGPDYGYTQITVKGRNFIDMGHNQAICVFNKTIFTNATVIDDQTMMCDSPSLLNAQGYSKMTDKMLWYTFDISVNRGREISGPSQQFNYYRDPKIFELIPNSGPISGGTKVAIIGKGFNQQGACNKTARFSVFETKPVTEMNDTHGYVISPLASNPDAVVVGVALNGQQFIKDITIHFRDVENTFEYYQNPVITSFEPKAGPSIGGTQVVLHGLGFTPKKDAQGNTDKSRNKMWIRFVDPDTHEALASTYQVKTEDLSDDQAIWYTPALPADTKALMQISLNSEDWQNVPIQSKGFSFNYYESPHITKLTPAFGPVKHKELLIMDIEGKNFKCPDPSCSDLQVRFGDQNFGIYVKGEWASETHIRVKVPKYTKPEVLTVELTVNGKDWTNDKLTYGYFDPYVLRAEPALISVDGTTKIRIIGFGFVNSQSSKSIVTSPQKSLTLVCQGKPCIKDAVFIDQNTIETQIYPQSLINYKETEQNILWDAMNIDASIHGSNVADFTDNSVQVFFYEDPDYKEISNDESPANIQKQIFITTDFKKNPIDRLKRYASVTCRFKNEDGFIEYSQGEILSYPFSNGNPNAVSCKTPKWNLRGKAHETVKLDIALNGQDFRGNLDFTFNQEIVIHRTIPMSGPVQGKSRTRIIGTGFKPLREDVQIKWGVLSTETVPKTQVEDYVYYQSQFENSIQGSEELKSYIYEASSFPRVDTVMEEEKTYHSFYMNSVPFASWTLTNGGPFYIEAGQNQELKYLTRANVTVKINGTNGTYISQIVEQDVIKSWIFYEYETSSVEYYHYKDCVVKDMQPHSGLISGGTKVTVSGAWFKYMPEYGIVPHCKFGNKIVRAQFESSVRIICITPPGDDMGVLYPFEISMNGLDWTDTGYKFSYFNVPEINSIYPTIGPESGATLIYFKGQNFFNMSNPQEFNCKFSAINMNIPPKKMPGIYANSSTIMCASPGGWGQGVAVKVQITFNGIDYDNGNFTFTFFSITRAFPRSGPSDGTGGDIIIEGYGFRNDTNPLCKLNNTITPPKSVSWNQIRCPMPRAQQGDQFFGNVELDVTPNGNDWHNFIGGFQYYPQPVVEDIYPKQGPNLGLGIINFYGVGFRNDYNLEDLACKIGDSIGVAIYDAEKKIVRCVVNDMPLVNQGESLPAQLALNRYSWTAEAVDPKKTSFTPYGIEQIYPNSGPITGETNIIIQGKGFELDENDEGATPRCKFGTPENNVIVEAQILSFERIACKAPFGFTPTSPGTYPVDVPLSIALSKDEVNDPWTESSHKFRFYEQPTIVKCDPCDVDVGTVREIYVWADENSKFFEPLPTVVLSQIDYEAQENDLIMMPNELSGIKCQFGRFGATSGQFINSSVIICVTPAVNDEPDSIYRETVKLTVTLNGVDYDEEKSEIEFTFIGTGSYIAFWPFLIGALLVALLIVALIKCFSALFQNISLQDYINSYQNQGRPHTQNGVPVIGLR